MPSASRSQKAKIAERVRVLAERYGIDDVDQALDLMEDAFASVRDRPEQSIGDEQAEARELLFEAIFPGTEDRIVSKLVDRPPRGKARTPITSNVLAETDECIAELASVCGFEKTPLARLLMLAGLGLALSIEGLADERWAVAYENGELR